MIAVTINGETRTIDDPVCDLATVTASDLFTTAWQYVEFAPTRLREDLPGEPFANSVQIAELELLNGGQPLDLSEATATATNNDSPSGEEPDKAIDGDITTKWLSFNKTGSTLQVDLGEPRAFDTYRWATANDHPERDPIGWELSVSTDGIDWQAVDNRDDASLVPEDRDTFLAPLDVTP